MTLGDELWDQDPGVRLRMSRLGIREEDLVESFVRSGGHGGQNVNKTSTCVILKHVPSGIQVRCQATRHQGQNRTLARELLVQRLESLRRQRELAERQKAELERRRSRKPSRAARQRMFQEKVRRATKKGYRGRVSED